MSVRFKPDGAITVHVAVVELTEDMDPMLFVARELAALHTQLRLAIEDLIINQVVPEHWPEIYAYATAHQGDDLEWGEWHEGLHELDGTPWVTIEEKEL